MQSHQNVDKVQSKFLKFSLGVSKFTSTSATLRELGQYPESLKATRLALMYFYRLEACIDKNYDSLLFNAYMSMKTHFHPWLESVKFTLAKHGLSSLCNNIKNLVRGYVKSKIKNRLYQVYEQENSTAIKEKGYLRLLYDCTKNEAYEKRKYLELVNSPSIRTVYSRIRMNSSRLSPNPYTTTLS